MFVGTQTRMISLENGRSRMNDTLSMLTTEDGRFWIQPQEGSFAIVVVDERGYAEAIDADVADGDIVLEPWAKVEGTLRLGARPQAGDVVLLAHRHLGPCELLYEWKAKADAQGRFTFDRVPPGRSIIAREFLVHQEFTGIGVRDHGDMIEAEPGQSIPVTIGGAGRPVVGKLVRDGKGFPIDDYFVNGYVMLADVHKMPAEYLEMNSQEHEAWLRSQRGQVVMAARERAMSHRYWVQVARDGTFRVEDVPEGVYQIELEIHEPNYGPSWGIGGRVARAAGRFAVPQMDGGRSDEPLDIGPVEVDMLTAPAATQPAPLQVGQIAPAFETRTLQGRPLKLADYRGKYVLLDFWATWCGPCIAELPHLRAVQEAFRQDPRFAMISLSLDESTDAPAAFVRRNGISWAQGFLGEWKTTNVPDQYGVQGIPAIFLIDPDGRILARDLRGPEILTAVRKALGEAPASRPAGSPASRFSL